MATIYKVEMEICSEFCSYQEDDLKSELEKMIKKWRSKETGLGLLTYNIKVKRHK